MYQEEYKRWLEADLEDKDKAEYDLKHELISAQIQLDSRSRNESYEYLCSTSGNTGTGELG